MRKIINNFHKFLLALLILTLASCGNKNVNPISLSEKNQDNIDTISGEPINNPTDSTAADNIEAVKSTETSSSTEDAVPENEPLQNNESNINSNNKVGFFSNKEIKILFNKFVANKNLPYSPLEENNIYVITSTIPIKVTAFEYYKMFFKSYDVVGFSLFDYGKNISFKNIKKIAQIKGANTVILKKVYNANKDIYIYDILYLRGKLSTTFFWGRNSEEALPINTTLQNLPSTENKNKYSLESILKIKQLNSELETKDKDESKNSLNALQPLDENNKLDSVNTSIIEDSTVVTKPKNIISAPASEMDKIRERLNTLVGLWMDSFDKSIVEIKEIPASIMRANGNITFINSPQVKYYGAYMVFNSNKKLEKYNSHEKINTSLDFQWKNNDLKFQFNSSGKNSVFLNYDKMPQVAMIRPFQEKGVIMVIFSNGEIRYYIPLGVDVSGKFIKKLYKSLPVHIDGKEMSIGKNPNYGSGMYGWLVSTGVILLSLGLITLF